MGWQGLRSLALLVLARGDEITDDGKVLARWRIVAHFFKASDANLRYEIVAEGQQVVLFTMKSEFLGCPATMGLALPILARSINEWRGA